MANNHKLRRFRKVAARKQAHKCWYCDAPMWSSKPEAFAEKHGLRLEDAAHFQCSAEHLVARRDGGAEVRNIVAACRYCNIARHECEAPMDAEAWRAHVQARVLASDWMTAELLRRA